jgi:hypothetical protein
VDEDRRTQYLVHRILSGTLIFKREGKTLELRSPSLELKYMSDVLYKHNYEQNIYEFILREDIRPLLLKAGYVTPLHDDDVKRIKKKVDNLKIQLYQNFWDRTRTRKNRQSLASAKKRQEELISNSLSLDHLTLEHHCTLQSMKYIIKNTLYDYETKELVMSEETTNKEYEDYLHYLNENMIDVDKIKKLARSEYWKGYYAVCKQNSFKEIGELTQEQKTLYHLSVMYEKITEHPDCPDDGIINDDDALDGWMLFQQDKMKAEKQKSTSKTDKIGNSQEVFYMAQNKEQAEDILNLNTNESMNIQKDRMKQVMGSDTPIQDQNLQDVKLKIQEGLRNQQKRV